MAMNPTDDEGLDALPSASGNSLPPSRQARFLLRVIIAAGGLLLLYLLLDFLRSTYADLLWFNSLGVRDVFTTGLVTRVVLFVVGLLVSAAALGGAHRFAFHHSWGPTVLPFSNQAIRWMRWSIIGGMIGIASVAAFSFASALASRWEMFLKFLNSTPFEISDPQFGLDVSFYAFSLPVLHTIQGWLMGLAIVVLVTTAGIYMLIFSARGINPIITGASRNQFAVVGALLMVTIAAAHFLDTYETLFSPTGAVTGATYADVTARLPALRLLSFVALVSAAIMLLSMRVKDIRQSMRMLLAAFGLWVVAALIAGLGWPALVQRFAVDPSELQRERPYIERNIAWTRMGYDLERISERPYDVKEETLADDIANNPETINNIRLWDPRPLEDVYNQIQHLRLYYNFLDVDVDRYVIDDEYRQVLVGSREIFQLGLDDTAQNWVNRRLQYTHGFGVAMSPATGFTPAEGLPEFFIQDIPIRGEIPIQQPELYYSESPAPFAIVNSTAPEIDPSGSELHYDGGGGVNLGSTLRRLAYAWKFADINIVLSDQISSGTRIQYRRQISDRVKTLAPFLTMDDDPYPVVDGAGKMWWLQDAFTTTDRYPYSTRTQDGFNYIRNSVKAVVDAFSGEVFIYALDPNDPLLQMYRHAFPTLFLDFDRMPADLQSHIRYPNGLFSPQADMYLRYHVTDAQVFFNQAEQWAIPQDTRFGHRGVEVHPSYLILQMPGGDGVEFVLMLPFSPAGEKKNLVGWLTARNDGEHYGKLNAFMVPSDPQVDGPAQVEARIENDQVISQQFTLWDGAGSQVVRGQLLVIPVGDAIIYVEPLYLQSEVLAFPELKKVILADGSNVVMADSVDEGLAMLLDDKAALVNEPRGGDGRVTPGSEDLQVIENAVTGLDEALKQLQEAVERLRESLDRDSH